MYSQETDVHRQNGKGFLPLLYVIFVLKIDLSEKVLDEGSSWMLVLLAV